MSNARYHAVPLLASGVALALSGLALTGGSFGLLAFIGMPLLMVGLGLIGGAQSALAGGPAGPARRPTPALSQAIRPIQETSTP